MLTRLSKDVVCIKDLQSNLIEEAFFILKSNGIEEGRNGSKRKESVMLEINDIIDEYSQKIKFEKEERKRQEAELNNKYKKVKLKSLMITAVIIVSILIVMITKM